MKRLMKKGDRLLCPRSEILDSTQSGGRGQSCLSPFFINLMKRAAIFLFALLPLAADSRTSPTSTTVQGGTFQYPTFLATGGPSGNWHITAIPDPGVPANMVQVSCSGIGVAAYNGGFNINGTTVVNVPITLTSTSGTATCTLNFADGTQPYNSIQVALAVSQNALSYASTNAGTQLDPVSTASGELFEAPAPDLSENGPIPLQFTRGYGSFIGTTKLLTRMGANWMHNFEWILTLNSARTQATVTFFGSEQVTFIQSGSAWQLTTPERYGYQFASAGSNTWLFLDPRTNLVYVFTGSASTLAPSAIQDRNGNALNISPVNGTFSSVSDGMGRELSFRYDPQSGNLLQVNDQDNRSVSFVYTGSNLTEFTDANGNSQHYSYTSSNGVGGLITAHTLPAGNTPFTQTFDNIGRVLTQTDASGNSAAFAYDQPVGSTAFTDASGATVTDFSRNYSDLLTHSDPDKQSLTITYDANGHRSSVKDRLGRTISATYHSPSGYLASITDAAGKTTTFNWSAQTEGPFTFYNLASVQYSDGSSVSYSYDSNGNALTSTDQAGHASTFTYNSRGQVTAATDPDGHTTAYKYNADGTLASIADAAGNTTAYSYDGAKRISQVRLADGNTRSFTYDNLDHLTGSVNESGQATSFAYTPNEQLATRSDAHGESSRIVYNAQDLVQSKTDRTLNQTTYAYDSTDRVKSFTAPAGETYAVTRDSHHRVATSIDPAGNATTFGYDKEDGLTSITDALSRTTSITRDALGRRTKLTTPLGESYAIAYDNLSRVTSLTDPTSLTTAFQYDPRGILKSVSTGGFTTALTSDNAGLLTSIADPNANAWNYSYDSAGRLAALADPLKRMTAYSYDNRNRVSSLQLPLGSANFAYDARGDLIERAYSDGTTINYTWDPVYGVTAGTGVALGYDFEGRVTGSNGLIVTRDADGRISSILYAPGKTVKYAYNSVGLLASLTDWISGSTTFTYDAAHELTSITRPNGLATHFTYDQDGRVASITEDAGPAITIQRDAAGRLISETRTHAQTPAIAAGTLPLSYDAAEQVASYTYDADGRVTTDALRSYTWDLASQLISYSGADGSASFTYDAFGLRTSRSDAAGIENFVWDYATPIPSLAIVRNSTSADVRYYIYSPEGKLLYAIDAVTNARHYYHFDENGSTTLLTDDTSSITDSYGITPLGETVTQDGSTPNPFTWRGEFGVMAEGSTSLFCMRDRYYDSTSSRFLSPAAVTALRSNPYAFAPNDAQSFDRTVSAAPAVASHAIASGPPLITRYIKPAEFLADRVTLLPAPPRAPGILDLTRSLDHPLTNPPVPDPFESPENYDEFRFRPFVSSAAEILSPLLKSVFRCCATPQFGADPVQ